MFFVHVLGCVVLGVLGTRIPISTFLLTWATTTPSSIPVEEDEMAYQTPQSTTADLSLADLQDLFKKILWADIAHFKTTPGYEKSPEEKETIPSDTAPGGEVHPSQASPDIPTTRNKISPVPLPATKSDANNTSLLTHLVISGELSLMISCTALALSAGTICHLPCTVVG
jgi:hypothetical protein